MRAEACLAAWKNGVSLVYLKLPLFFSKEALYSLCDPREETWWKIYSIKSSMHKKKRTVVYDILYTKLSLKSDPSPHCTESCSSQPATFQVCPTHSSQFLSATPGPPCTWPVKRHQEVTFNMSMTYVPFYLLWVYIWLCAQFWKAIGLTVLTFSLAILLKKNSGRSGMDFHVPRELMYFSLYLTWGWEKSEKDARAQIEMIFKVFVDKY